MFHWLYNYVDIEDAIYLQNDILQNMIEHMDKSSNSSLMATVILGLITIFITIYLGNQQKELSEQQNEILKKQYNFERINKCLLAVDQFKKIMDKAITFNLNEDDYYALWKQMNDFISTSDIVFKSEIKEKIIEAKKSFEDYHRNNDVIELFNKESNNYSPEEYKNADKCVQDAHKNVPSLQREIYIKFSEALDGMLDFIRKM